MKISHFTDLEVWQKAHRLFLDRLADTGGFPRQRAADIPADQILRSSGSVSANIAEGFNRSTRKLLSALDIAVGEANETENWLYKLRDAQLITSEVALKRIDQYKPIGRMINGLIRSIETRHQ